MLPNFKTKDKAPPSSTILSKWNGNEESDDVGFDDSMLVWVVAPTLVIEGDNYESSNGGMLGRELVWVAVWFRA